MSNIFEEIEKIESKTKERIEKIEKEEELRRLEEKEKAMREEAEKQKTKAQKKILGIIENQNLELDEPRLWTVKYSLGNPITFNMKSCSKTVVLTERQKKLLEVTDCLEALVGIGGYAKFESIIENQKEVSSDSDKAKLEGDKQKIELLKTSEDSQLDEKGLYYSWCGNNLVETEMTLRQALLVTIPETRSCFKTYTQIKDEEEKKRLEEERNKKAKNKSSKITLKSIKNAIKNKLNIR